MPTVLLVDDDPLVMGLLRDVFALWGWQVVSAATHAAARRVMTRLAAGGGRLDLLVVDLRLPDGSGDDLLAELQGCGAAMPRALIVSGEPDIATRAGRIGVPYLAKPFDIRALAGAVDELAPQALSA